MEAERRLMRALRRLQRSRPAAVELVIAKLDDPFPEARWRAAYSLGKTQQRAALPALLKLLDDPDEVVQVETEYALRYLNDPRGIAILAERIANMSAVDPRREMEESILAFLAEQHPQVTTAYLRDGPASAACEIVRALPSCYDEEDEDPVAVRLLRFAMESPVEQIRQQAAETWEKWRTLIRA